MAELSQDVEKYAKASQAELDLLSVHIRAAGDAIARCIDASSASEARAELATIKHELGEARLKVVTAKANLSWVHVSVATAKMTGQMEKVQPLPLETWREQAGSEQRELMLAGLHRAGDHTLDPEGQG